MEFVKRSSIGLLAAFSAAACAEAPAPPFQPSEPTAIIWDTSWPGCQWAGNCLVSAISFSNAYPKAFYKTDKFTYSIIVASVAAAATLTFVTAGAGAPAVVPGASSLIVLIGGGGQGAYMAGLSTIGNLIGSNAIGGAAVINAAGALIGTVPVKSTAAFGGLALKTMIGVSTAAYDGILIGQNEKTDQLVFATELRIPPDMGSKWVRDLVDSIYHIEKQAVDALSRGYEADFERYFKYQQADLNRGLRAVEQCWEAKKDCASQELTRDDLIVLAIMAHKAGHFDLFHKVITYVRQESLDTDRSLSFLNYLYATSLLMRSEFDQVGSVLLDAIDKEPNAIEPALLYIVFLAYTGFAGHEAEIESRMRLLQRKFKADKYETAYSLATVYYRLGAIYAMNERHVRALQYFEESLEALNFMQKWPIFSKFMQQQFRTDIELAMANSYFSSGSETKGNDVFTRLCGEARDTSQKEVLAKRYAGASKCPDAGS